MSLKPNLQLKLVTCPTTNSGYSGSNGVYIALTVAKGNCLLSRRRNTLILQASQTAPHSALAGAFCLL